MLITLFSILMGFAEPHVLPYEDFDSPAALTTDADGRILIINEGSHQVVCLTPKGEEVWRYGRKGQGPGEFTQPTDLIVDAKGNVLVGDWGQKKILVLDRDGKFVQNYPNIDQRNGFMLMRANGNLVFNEGTGRYFWFRMGQEETKKPILQEFNAKGETVTQYGTYVENKESPILAAFINLGFPLEINGRLHYVMSVSNEVLTFDGTQETRFRYPIHFEPPKPTAENKKETIGGKTTIYTKAIISPTAADADAAPDGRIIIARYKNEEEEAPVELIAFEPKTKAVEVLVGEMTDFIRLTVDRKNKKLYYLSENDEGWVLSSLAL